MGKHFKGKTYWLTQDSMNGLIAELEHTQEDNRIMREALEKIARQDFRGNRPYECVLAEKALSELGDRK